MSWELLVVGRSALPVVVCWNSGRASGCAEVAQGIRRWSCSSLSINLSENGAFGSCLQQLCGALSNLPLTKLSVLAQHSHFNSSEVEKLWRCALSLRFLQEINLDFVGNRAAVAWQTPRAWPGGLRRLSLDVSENPGCRPVLTTPAFDGVSLSLIDLDVGLRGMRCSQETALSIAGAFAELRTLRRCKLDVSRARGGVVPMVIRGFSSSRLADFSLVAWDCDLRDDGAAGVGEAVAAWSSSLVQLSLMLTSNGIGAAGARRLVSGVVNCSQLTSAHVEAGWGTEPFVWWDLHSMQQWLRGSTTAAPRSGQI
mmetsp:Transcript_34019/g.88823  ORF Transcript_34019/g.88823 Transcript_34019/m.88823 type:complete len:311 (+) Transcript_34019:2357-3289(+)